MATIETSEQLKDHIKALSETLTQLRSTFQDSITSNPIKIPTSIQIANVSNPIDEIPKLSSLINAHTTKVGLVFKPPIAKSSYNACKTEVDSLVKYAILLISLLYQIQKNREIYSKLFVNELSYDGLSILEVCIMLLNNLIEVIDINVENENETEDNDEKPKKETNQRLASVGLIWDSCEKLTKSCKNGSSGILRIKLKQANKLVIDALDELKEWLENPIVGNGFDFDDDDIFGLSHNDDGKIKNEENLSDEEQADEDVIAFGNVWSTKIQLIKLLISLLDKSIPTSKYNVKFSKGLDLLNETCLKINEYVDDLVACTVYDADIAGGEKASKLLNNQTNQILELVRKINNDDEKKCKWLDSWKHKYQEA